MIRYNIDWAENYTIPNPRMLQSLYWIQRQVSIFISICSVLDPHIYYGDGVLEEGDEVTVQIEGASNFWASVVEVNTIDGCKKYTVRDAQSKIHAGLPRNCLFKRVWVSIAFVSFTGDKHHDSYATQHFMNLGFADIKDRLAKKFSGYTFTKVAIHSDNAASHFKNSRSKHWFSNVMSQANESGFEVMYWSYGCPGHGCPPP